MMKLSNTKLFMNNIKLLVISMLLTSVIVSAPSCDKQETTPAYAKVSSWIGRGFDRLKCLDNPLFFIIMCTHVKWILRSLEC